jgi:hypothetical protein
LAAEEEQVRYRKTKESKAKFLMIEKSDKE